MIHTVSAHATIAVVKETNMKLTLSAHGAFSLEMVHGSTPAFPDVWKGTFIVHNSGAWSLYSPEEVYSHFCHEAIRTARVRDVPGSFVPAVSALNLTKVPRIGYTCIEYLFKPIENDPNGAWRLIELRNHDNNFLPY